MKSSVPAMILFINFLYVICILYILLRGKKNYEIKINANKSNLICFILEIIKVASYKYFLRLYYVRFKVPNSICNNHIITID